VQVKILIFDYYIIIRIDYTEINNHIFKNQCLSLWIRLLFEEHILYAIHHNILMCLVDVYGRMVEL